jgi:hypothetical protein
MRNAQRISTLILVACLCSCVHKEPLSLPGGKSIFPSEFVITQHILWKFRGKDYEFVSYAVRKQGQLSVQFFNDLGGKVFDFSADEAGKVLVKKKPEHMPERFITNGIGRDFWIFYNLKMPADASGPQKIAVDQTTFEFLKDSDWPRSATISNPSQKSILKVEILSVR